MRDANSLLEGEVTPFSTIHPAPGLLDDQMVWQGVTFIPHKPHQALVEEAVVYTS
jgi:hypothetical protein